MRRRKKSLSLERDALKFKKTVGRWILVVGRHQLAELAELLVCSPTKAPDARAAPRSTIYRTARQIDPGNFEVWIQIVYSLFTLGAQTQFLVIMSQLGRCGLILRRGTPARIRDPSHLCSVVSKAYTTQIPAREGQGQHPKQKELLDLWNKCRTLSFFSTPSHSYSTP